MKRFLYAVLSFGILLSAINAQSGRRIKRTSTAQSKSGEVVIDPNVYSESRPFKPVLLTPGKRKKKKKKPKAVETKPTAVEEGDDDIISVDSSLVTIPVSVFDRDGIYISSIQKKEFKIFEDGVEQEIAYFGRSDEPFTVALMIDTSGSTHFKIEDIHYAAKMFVRLLEPQDKVLVIEFSGGTKVRAEATNDRPTLDRAIDKSKFGGSTSLYRAVQFTLRKRMDKIKGRKAIVLFTDGVDTSGWLNGYRDNYEDAEESDTLIYPVFYNTFLGSLAGGGITTRTVATAQQQGFGKSYLEQLASYTGGRMFHAGRSRAILMMAFQGIAQELRRQYSIGYSPIDAGEKGERKRIKVRVYRPDLRVRARDSYIVGEAKDGDSGN